MKNQLEKLIREYAIDFETKALIANELLVLAEQLKVEAVEEMAVMESKIMATRQLLGDVVVTTPAVEEKQAIKPQIVTADEVKEEKLYEAKNFEYSNRIEAEGAKLQGSFTYNRKKYYFQASDNMARPMVYGAKNMNIVDACMKAIETNIDDTFYDDDFKDFCTNVNNADRYYIDMEREIMIYFAPDGSFKGYFQGKAFVWNPETYKVPTYANYKNSLDTTKYRPMKNIGQAELIMKLCLELREVAKYLNKKKKEVVVEQKEEVKEEVIETTDGYYWDDKIQGDPDEWDEEVDF